MSASSEPATARLTLVADLHARPAGQVARTVAAHDAKVRLASGEREADARSVLAMLSLGAVAGQTVSIWAEGPQAAQALAAVTELLVTAPAVTH